MYTFSSTRMLWTLLDEKINHQSFPASNPVNYINLWAGKTYLLVKKWQHPCEISTSLFIELKIGSKRCIYYLASSSGQETMARKVIGSGKEHITLSLLGIILTTHLMTSPHQLKHFLRIRYVFQY